jgi:hypothetical protein
MLTRAHHQNFTPNTFHSIPRALGNKLHVNHGRSFQNVALRLCSWAEENFIKKEVSYLISH